MGQKVFKYIFSSLFMCFLILYFSSLTGYYEYQNHRKANLTENEIKKFENDIKSGKKVDAKDYLSKEITYDNKISKLASSLSNKISEITTTGLTEGFKYLSKFIDN